MEINSSDQTVRKILVVTDYEFNSVCNKEVLFENLADIDQSTIDIIQVNSVDQAESILFEASLCLIIIDWKLERAVDFTRDLKNDEMFRLLPVIVMLYDQNDEEISNVFLSGADNYVFVDKIKHDLPLILRPLIRTNVLNDEMIQKLSVLQDKAIHNFILLDLIKKYIPKTIWDVANDFASEQKIHIPEEELELTIAFGDIKGFTMMSEHLPPAEIIKSLNSVFEIVTRIVYETEGDIDKFIGDAFLAVFLSPIDAVKAMIRVQREISALNIERIIGDLTPICFRIGVHTGPVIRGNVGGNRRYDNTLIGDTVNTAARLEQVSLPGDVLISESTRQKANIELLASKKSQVKLKGKDIEVIVHQVYEELMDRY